ncbi:MAG: pectate lyase [Polyangiales bacterium]
MTTPTVQGNAPGVVGFASLNRAGRNGTNGGAGGATVTVRDYAGLVAAVGDDAPRIVRITGAIRGAGPMVRVGSNKTIEGVGAGAGIDGFGFNVSGFGGDAALGDACDPAEKDRFRHVENVIIRNLSFRNSADDSINVQCYSHHVWVDHNTFYVSHDGSVDVKRGADWVTVSWNRFTGTDKSMLLGHSDDNGTQDRGFLHATYHHNWFDKSNTRHPRVRFGQAHVFNNYANGITDYFVGAGVECDITAEGNYTDAIKRLVTYWDGVKVTWASSNVQATPPHAKDGLVQNGRGFSPRSYYAYTLDAAASIPNLVSRGAGAGRI